MPSSKIIPLEALELATPCKADWNAMSGNDQVRFCGSFHKNVYNLAAMTRAEAESLVMQKEGNLCAILRRRADGTVITSDCPVGITPPRRPSWWFGAAVSALVGVVAGCTGLPVQARPVSAELSTNNLVAPGGIMVSPNYIPRPVGARIVVPPPPTGSAKRIKPNSISRKSRAKRMARRPTAR